MSKAKIFIDGSAGTTGLQIYERLALRNDIELISLSEDIRKDIYARRDALNTSDIAFLCLPDAAAKESVSLLENQNTVIIDTSTAHRTEAGWCYGFPELHHGAQKEKIHVSKRIANPGCHASGFIALVAPLRECGILSADATLSCFSITGYSGGGKKMIAEYESTDCDPLLRAPRQYALTQQHKHLKEMSYICNLNTAPIFSPIVSSFYSGMEVTVPLFQKDVHGTINDIVAVYKESYLGPCISYSESDENGFLSASLLSGKDDMKITVYGNEERILLISRFDNLGKGACGSALQNMNIVLGCDQTTGLNLS